MMNAMQLDTLIIWIPTFWLVSLRLIGLLAIAPVFGHSAIPLKLRIAMALVIALAVVARSSQAAFAPSGAAELVLAGCAELAIGAVIGLAASVLFAGVQLGAFHISSQMGLSLAEIFNPTQTESAGVVRPLLTFLAVVVFLSIGGHRSLLSALLGSFQAIPPATGANAAGMLPVITGVLGASFVLALKVAGPLLIAMLLATVAMGFIQKTIPQCNLLTTYLPVRALFGMLMLAASVAVISPLMNQAADLLMRQLTAIA